MARSDSGAIRITTAGSGPAADLARRQRRYLVSMSIRALCFVGAVISGAYHVNWLWPILIGAALILPYFAVVMANANDSRQDTMGLVNGVSPYRELDEADDDGDDDEGPDGA
ncbi:MAG: DUF3099 domain-containing protein [Nocardioidaceae bacterium]|nr:DUF3099 domain-containing protein [Nocardioidaceae bacterium]MCL2612152.1 DUF3099 domain-containing protein [Nocardioidaceae bacterium]